MRQLAVAVIALVGCGEVNKLQADAAIDGAVDAPADADYTPRVIDLTPPDGVYVEGGTGMVSATLGGPPSTMMTVTFAGTLGTYTPPSITVTTNANGQAMVMTTYTTGSATVTPGMEMSIASITSPSGAMPRSFAFPVIPLARQGNTTQFGGVSSFSPDFLLGEPITTTVSGHLKRLGFIYSNATAQVKVGIYADAAGSPGALVAQLPATQTQAGSFEVALATPVSLPAGTYWILGLHNVSGPLYYNSAAGANPIAYVQLPFASALPDPFPVSHSSYTGQSFNWWFVIGQ